MTRRIVIVGGGTSGWMTACYLKRALRGVDVTLVESPDIRTIGVGEATFSTIKLFFDYLGLAEHEWMPRCNASYKLAIKFVGWNQNGSHFYHPFQRYEKVDGYDISEWWLKLGAGKDTFDSSCFTVPALCEARRSPRYLDGRVYDENVQAFYSGSERVPNTSLANHEVQYPYGYHFDAGLLAGFLEEYATRLGVCKVEDEVVEVALREDGGISHIVPRQHGSIAGDLFIDCTGFRGLLINQALQEPFISYGDSLLNDRAVAMRVPVDILRNGIEPYTTATALSSGWVWNIPLYNRVGTGYVYSSQFLSPEEAEAEFRSHLRQKLGPAADGCQANHIRMRIGRSRNAWVKNCVAIGLSSGFVEPLESTGIFFIQHGIEELVHHFPQDGIDEGQRSDYNQAVGGCMDGIREFLTLHYQASTRDDTPYWQAVKRETHCPDGLAERLDLWRRRLPDAKTINPHYHGFEAYSYSVMLLGLGNRPSEALPMLDCLDADHARAAFADLRARGEHLVKTLPSLAEYLTQVRRRADRDEEAVPLALLPFSAASRRWQQRMDFHPVV